MEEENVENSLANLDLPPCKFCKGEMSDLWRSERLVLASSNEEGNRLSAIVHRARSEHCPAGIGKKGVNLWATIYPHSQRSSPSSITG